MLARGVVGYLVEESDLRGVPVLKPAGGSLAKENGLS